MTTHKHKLKIVKSIIFGRILKFKCKDCGEVMYFWRHDVNSMVKGKVFGG